MSKEIREKRRADKREVEARERIRVVQDFCVKALPSKDREACPNRNRKDSDEKGCKFCFQFSNFVEIRKKSS